LVDDAEPASLFAIYKVGGEIELARLRGADKTGQAPRAAVIARIADAREGRAEARRFRGDAQIAGERKDKARARARPVDRGDHDLRHRADEQRQSMRLAQSFDAVLEGLVALARLHRLDVAAGAPAAPGAGNDDDAAIMVGREALQRCLEPRSHLAGQRVEA